LVEDVEVLRPVDFSKKYKDEEKQDNFPEKLAAPEYFRCDCHGKWKIVVPVDDCCPDFLREFKKVLDRKLEKSE
jgi:hypothetical protein